MTKEELERRAKKSEYDRIRDAGRTPEQRARRKAQQSATNKKRNATPKAKAKEREVYRTKVQKETESERASRLDKARNRSRRARHDHPQKIIEGRRASRAANPQKYRDSSRIGSVRRRARKMNATGSDYTTKDNIKSRWDMFFGLCWMCGDKAEAMDHVKPLSKGGSNFPSNQRPACKYCNGSKCAIWPYPTTTVGLRTKNRELRAQVKELKADAEATRAE